jgi:hypothetical protein
MTASTIGAQFTVTLGGIPLTVVPDPTGKADPNVPAYSGSYETQESDLTFRKRDVPQFIRRFDRGCGFVEMRDQQDDGGYAWAEDMMMWLGNGALPSGRRTATASSYGVTATGAVTDSVLFNGSLHGISAKGGLWWAGTNPAAVPTISPALNAFGDPTSSWRAGYLAKAVVLFKTAAGVPCVVVSTYNAGTGATRMYQYTVAGGWARGRGRPGLSRRLDGGRLVGGTARGRRLPPADPGRRHDRPALHPGVGPDCSGRATSRRSPSATPATSSPSWSRPPAMPTR